MYLKFSVPVGVSRDQVHHGDHIHLAVGAVHAVGTNLGGLPPHDQPYMQLLVDTNTSIADSKVAP